MEPTALDAATLEKLISAASAAPSFHNTQPWRYRLDPETATLELRVRPDRALREMDPTGRALHISIGAALFNLRVAVAHFGWRPVVRLLPRYDQPEVLASVRLAGPAHERTTHGRDLPDLYESVWHRHSSRFPFDGRALPAELLASLADAAYEEDAVLRVPGPAETRRLLRITAEGEWRTTNDRIRRAESRAWIREEGREGLPSSALGPQDAGGHIPVRDFSALSPRHHRAVATFESSPTIAVLSTARDDRSDWLRAGQALEHVLLVATAHSLRASLLHQALEWPDLRWALRDAETGPSHVQMLMRLGYGPAGPETPRRETREVLESGVTA
ncbi:hypothetical protein NGB36_22125 [Streptomyces sp. RB6PN25]|uniref:Nitroreductase domain-containing protein n=1 Tax=Streptomyces humicola TaxID=2953240 RepID=A0ABT1Q3A0_9ACTN|nr:nitroreductase family protein [Streptomyces humicola]MCQ4083225.1 hypothetical protein [Streptomyces humicola]